MKSSQNAAASALVLFIFQLRGRDQRRRRRSLVIEHLHARERLALEQLQRGAAAGGQVRDGVREAELRSAAAESPPPTTVVPSQRAIASATARVPAANGSSSKAPIGPFQNTVRAAAISRA